MLIAGYTTGQILLWNLTKQQLVKLIDLYNSSILALKFIHSADLIVSASAEGTVCLTKILRGFVRVSYTNSVILKENIIFSIDVLKADPLKSNAFDDIPLVALGGINKAFVVVVKSEAKVIWKIKKVHNSRNDIVCVAWGRGGLMEDPENCNPILAIAWSNVVQLVEVKNLFDNTKGYVFHGYYESSYEIQTLQWISESVLIIFTSANELKILYSGNFTSGKYEEKMKEEALERDLMRKKSKKLITPELESPFKVTEDLCIQLHNVDIRKSQVKSSYIQALVVNNNEVICLAKNHLLKGKLLTWEDYMEKVKGTSSWVTILWVALEIYLGSIKGFANFTQYAGVREPMVRQFMQSYITKSLKTFLSTSTDDLVINILQSTVEFCVKIGAYDYMLNELLIIFMEQGLEYQYLETIEHYLFANAFKSIVVSKEIVYKQVNYYIKEGKPKTLERVLVFLNLKGQDLDHLANVCIANKMFTALIYIKTYFNDPKQYIIPAELMMEELRNRNTIVDIKELVYSSSFNSVIEESGSYLGYKLLWYIQLCFKGEKFPHHNEIPITLRPHIVYSLIDWLFKATVKKYFNINKNSKENSKVKNDNNLQVLLRVNARVTFQVLGMLFQTPELKDYIANSRKYSDEEQPKSTELIKRFAVAAQEVDSQRTHSQYYFNLFLAQISSQSGTHMEPILCISTAKSLLSYKFYEKELTEYNEYIHEELIKDMLKNCISLNNKQLDSLIKEANKSSYIEVIVYLEEIRRNYAKCFEVYLSNKQVQKRLKIFNWLKCMWSNKREDEVLILLYDNIEELVILDVEKAVYIMDIWFKGKHNEIINKLTNNPLIQLKYLSVLLNNKEMLIECKV